MSRTKTSTVAHRRRSMRYWLPLAILIAALTPAWALAAEPLSPAGLMAADRAFAVAAAKDGLAGWMSYMAKDVVKLDIAGDLASGSDAMRTASAPYFADASTELRWEPTDAGLFADGGTGFTRGRYTMVKKDDAGAETELSRGHYLTIWRFDDGGWKVILDTGVPADSQNHDDH